MTLTDLKTLSISIIIPVRNEEGAIGACLDSLPVTAGLEILMVDGNSTDQTLAEIRKRGQRVIQAPPGRGSQQHAGALAACGEILLFLHCDTRLPCDFAEQVQEILQEKDTAAGAFRLGIDARGTGYRIIEWGANLRSRVLQQPYGDQALFMRRTTYFAAGGFPEQPILEDVALVSRLKQQGRITIARASVRTSARRWQQRGLIRTTVVNQLMLAGRAAGIPATRLGQWYYKK